METTNKPAIPEAVSAIAKKLDSSVASVIGNDKLEGFEKAYSIAFATNELRKLLTDEYMKPIMALQGNRLGFKTDKDKESGYPMPVVRDCLIEAVLMGFQPVGNQFNIIAGNTYGTKEGFGALLKKIEGLSHEVIPELPRIDVANGKAAIKMKIDWTMNGNNQSREIEFPITLNKFMGADAVIGKATRKARHWLYNTIMNTEFPEGDASDSGIVKTTAREVNPNEKIEMLIDSAETTAHLDAIKGQVPDEVMDKFNAKYQQLGGKLL